MTNSCKWRKVEVLEVVYIKSLEAKKIVYREVMYKTSYTSTL